MYLYPHNNGNFFSKFFFTLETQKKKIGVFLYHLAMEKKQTKEI
jgi:hypothetical protein